MYRLLLYAFVVLFFWCDSLKPASGAVLYRSKSGWFRLELSGYLKNFLLIQTGTDRFLPEQAPNSLARLDELLRALGAVPGNGQDLQASWDEFRRQLGTLGSDLTRLRLRMKMKFGSSVSVHMDYELRPLVQAGPSQFLSSIPSVGALFGASLFSQAGGSSFGGLGLTAFTSFDDRYLDFPRNIFNTYSFQLSHELDRLYLTWALPFADITIGRQAIVFGMGQVFRPTDVLSPFSPQEIDKEERRGVDAIKITFPLGDLSELMVVGVLQRLRPSQPRKVGEASYFDDISPGGAVRFRTTVWSIDFFVMAGYIQRDIVAGAGLSGSLFGAGWRAEAVYRYRLPTVENDPQPNGVFSASVGIDYNLASRVPWLKLIIALEYYHNGAGAVSPDRYLDIARSYRFQRGEVFSLAANYLALLLRWEAHPLVHLNMWGMLNFHDGSVLLAPSLEYSIKQDVSVFFAAYFGIGAYPEVSFAQSQQNGQSTENINLSLKSEFGSVGMLFTLGIRIYF